MKKQVRNLLKRFSKLPIPIKNCIKTILGLLLIITTGILSLLFFIPYALYKYEKRLEKEANEAYN